MNDLIVDESRINLPETGISIRAKFKDKWGTYDIIHLTKKSLLGWLRMDGGGNKLAENCVGIVLGHGHLHEP